MPSFCSHQPASTVTPILHLAYWLNSNRTLASFSRSACALHPVPWPAPSIPNSLPYSPTLPTPCHTIRHHYGISKIESHAHLYQSKFWQLTHSTQRYVFVLFASFWCRSISCTDAYYFLILFTSLFYSNIFCCIFVSSSFNVVWFFQVKSSVLLLFYPFCFLFYWLYIDVDHWCIWCLFLNNHFYQCQSLAFDTQLLMVSPFFLEQSPSKSKTKFPLNFFLFFITFADFSLVIELQVP